jgi:hypothetical protein
MPTLIIDVTVPQAQRIVAAFGRENHLKDQDGVSRDATQAEVRLELIRYMREVVVRQEKIAARITADSSVPDLDITP